MHDLLTTCYLLLTTTCVGKDTNLSASYWLTLDTMLEMEEKENLR